MVGIITGLGLGTQMGSLSQLGSSEGELGTPEFGGFGENVYVNAATGNLVIERTDEILDATGPDDDLSMVYNSLAASAGYGENNQWQTNDSTCISTVSGTLGVSGSSVTLTNSDGSTVTFSYSGTSGSSYSYVCTAEPEFLGYTLTYNSAANPDDWTLTNPATNVSQVFDPSNGGRLIKTYDTSGNTLTYTYTGSELTKVQTQSSDNEYTTLTYTDGNLTSVATYYYANSTAESGDTYTELSNVNYTYTDNLLTAVTVATSGSNSVTITYGYETSTDLIDSISETGGDELTIGYNTSNQVTSLDQTIDSGVTTTTAFSYGSGETSITDNSGNVTKMYYDGNNDLTEVTLPPAQSGATALNLNYSYYSAHNVETAEDAEGNATTYNWNTNGTLNYVTDALGTKTQYYYDSKEHVTVVTTSVDGTALATTRYAYDTDERLCYMMTPDGMVTAYTNNSLGEVTGIRTYPNDTYNLSGLSSSEAISKSTLDSWKSGLTDLSTTNVVMNTYDWRGNLVSSTAYSAANSSGNGITTSPYTATNYSYDESGNLKSKSVSDGTGVSYTNTYTYDGLNRLISETDPGGNTTTTTYNDSSNTVTMALSNGLSTVNTYNLAGQLIQSAQSGTDTVTATTTYQYDDTASILNDQLGNLAAVTDPNGNTTYYLYDNLDRQVAAIAPNGAITRTIYTADNQVAATVTYANPVSSGNMTTIETTNSNGQFENPALSSILPSSSSSDIWNWNVYDGDGNLIETIDGNGYATVNTYDAFGNLIQTTAYATPFSSSTVSGFQSTPPPTLETPTADTGQDDTTRYFYNNEGQVIGTLNAQGYLTENIYNNSGQKIQITQFATQASSSLWASGTLSELLSSVGATSQDRTTQYFYDGRGLLVYELNAELVPTEYVYDNAGNLVETYQYAGAVSTAPTTNTVAAIQSAISGTSGLSTNSANRATWYVYDTTTGLLDFKIDGNGDVTEYSYNTMGQVTQTTQFATTRTTTSLPTLTTMQSWATSNGTGAEITSSVYNIAGQLAYSIDAVGDVTKYEYDAAGNVVGEIRYATQNPVTSVPSESTMDSWASTNASNTQNEYTYSVYNTQGQLAYTLNSLTYTSSAVDFAVTQYQYDTAGQVVETRQFNATDNGVTSPPSLSTMNSWASSNSSNSLDQVTYSLYDAKGQLVYSLQSLNYSSGDANFGVTEYFYGMQGELLAKWQDYGTYATNSLPTLSELPGPTTVLGRATYYFYDDLGRQTLEIDPDGYATATTYNFANQVSSVTHYATPVDIWDITMGSPPTITADPGSDATTSFTYNLLGQEATETSANQNESNTVHSTSYTTESFGYDAFGDETTEVNALGGTITSTYDHTGNMLSQTVPESEYYYSGSDVTYVGATVATSYTYDAFGNRHTMVQSQGTGETSTTTYTYDALNRLATETSPEVTDIANLSNLSTMASASPETAYTYDAFGDMIKTVDPDSGTTFDYYDLDNRKIAEVNADRALTVWSYDSFGNTATQTQYATEIPTTDTIATSTPVSGTGSLESWAGTGSGANREVEYTYDLDNRLITTTAEDVQTGYWNGSSYTVDSATSSIETSNFYDNFGNLLISNDGNGKSTYFYYDADGNKIGEVDPDLYLTSYAVDDNGNVTSETQYANQLTSGEVSFLSSVSTLQSDAGTSANNRTMTFTYDLDGNRLTQTLDGLQISTVGSGGAVTTSDANSTITWTYNAMNEVATVEQDTGDTTTNTYDAMGRLVETQQSGFMGWTGSATAAVQLTTTYEYDGMNDLIESNVYDADHTTNSRVTTYTYNADGWLATETDPTGFEQTYGYNKDGKVETDTYELAQATGSSIDTAKVSEFDALNQQTEQTVATKSGSTWTYGDEYVSQYNAFGEVSAVVVNGDTEVTNTYNNAGWLASTITGNGSPELFMYDADGNQTMAITPSDEYNPETYSFNWAAPTLSSAISILGGSGVIGTSDTATSDGMILTFTTYDARDMALSTVEPYREIGTSGSSYVYATVPGEGSDYDIASSQTYDAFGDVLSQTDFNGNTTNFTYSMLGEKLSMTQPSVAYTTDYSGTIATGTASPITNYYYDGSGREVGTEDPNGSTTSWTLLANSGYDGSQELVAETFNPDLSTPQNYYNVFGELGEAVDGDGDDTIYTYTGDGLVSTEEFPESSSAQLTDSYAYDGLGERIESWNSELTSSVKATTTYDAQGRVISSTDLDGYTTTYSYVWSNSIGEAEGLGEGGWVETTTPPDSADAGGLFTTVSYSDFFGNLLELSEANGDDIYGYGYDTAGRQTEEAWPEGGHSGYTIYPETNYTYYNTGRLASEDDSYTEHYKWYPGGDEQLYTITYYVDSNYAYDANGNRTLETLNDYQTASYGAPGGAGSTTPVYYEDATATYDALNRMSTLDDTDAEYNSSTYTTTTDPVTIAWSYDKDSNVIQQDSTYYPLSNTSGTISGTESTQDYWYEYDSMNRVVLDDGVEQSGAVVLGTAGVAYLYDAAGRRVKAEVVIPTADGTEYTYTEQLETYTYNPDGSLAKTYMAVGSPSSASHSYVTPPAISNTAATASGTLQSTYTLDAMDRVTAESEYVWSGSSQITVYSKTASYDNDSNVTTDAITTKHLISSTYVPYVQTDTYSYQDFDFDTQTYEGGYVGPNASVINTSLSINGGTATDSETYNLWGPVLNYTVLQGVYYLPTDNMDDEYITTENYNFFDQLTQANFYYNSSEPSYSNNYVENQAGQIVSNISTAGPASLYYFFNGNQEGVVTNNGTSNVTYAQSIAQQTSAPGSGYFADGASSGTPSASFGTDSSAINSYSANSDSPTYTVQSGDTLESIAQAMWGDSAYWYLIADANGIAGDSDLYAGETLTIPTLANNTQDNSSTNTVYNSTQAMGNLSPTHPPAPKQGGCGVMGEVFLAIIAIAVSAVLGPLIGGILGYALAGAIGSIVSQGIGLATGIQSKFNWAAVGEAAIGGAVGGGLQAVNAFSGVAGSIGGDLGTDVQYALQGITGAAVSQGLDVATGLQSKFNWLNVAGAGVGGFATAEADQLMGVNPQSTSPSDILLKGVAGTAGALANAATQTALGKGSFGQNFANAIPDAIGQTIGEEIEGGGDDDYSPSPVTALTGDQMAALFQPSLNAAVQQIGNEPPPDFEIDSGDDTPSPPPPIDSSMAGSPEYQESSRNEGNSYGEPSSTTNNSDAVTPTSPVPTGLHWDAIQNGWVDSDGRVYDWNAQAGWTDRATGLETVIVTPEGTMEDPNGSLIVVQTDGSVSSLPSSATKIPPSRQQMSDDFAVFRSAESRTMFDYSKNGDPDDPSDGVNDLNNSETGQYFLSLPASSQAYQDFKAYQSEVINDPFSGWRSADQLETNLYLDAGYGRSY